MPPNIVNINPKINDQKFMGFSLLYINEQSGVHFEILVIVFRQGVSTVEA